MATQLIFELTMHLDNHSFYKLLASSTKSNYELCETEDEYVDDSYSNKGIIVRYRNSKYKKKITLYVNATNMLDNSNSDVKAKICKLSKRIGKIFDHKYEMDDFVLSKATIVTDINVGNRETADAYIQVLKRIRMVKGFSPAKYDEIDDNKGFCLEGNTNGIDFLIYDLESRLGNPCSIKGILRAEVHLSKNKTISYISDSYATAEQIEYIAENASRIFSEIVSRIIPPGNFYKKSKAVELVHLRVEDVKLRRRMLNLINLIPEKKSLLLAQKALNYRRVDNVMREFARIGVSPVTISKRSALNILKDIHMIMLG